MENRLKMRISRMFRGSFGSCRTTGNLSDVVERAVFVPQTQKEYYYDVLVEKARPFPSICRPKSPQTATNSIFPRQKISGRLPTNFNGQYCPPASPASPLDSFYFDERKKNSNSKKKKKNKNNMKKKKKKKKKSSNRRDMSLFSSSSQDSLYFETNHWFNSDEDESDTLFSSRSTLSSDSSGSNHHRKKYSSRRRRANKSSKMGVLPVNIGKVKDSFAVVKSSSDPYNDFRTSMVEMIVEKQIFSAKDLEQLLQCFLSLNSSHHHRIIVEVFTEIYETLFSTWS